MIPGWPYSVIAALEPDRKSWTAVLDAVRLGPDDDETEVTAGQVREVITRLIAAGYWRQGDLPVLVVFDAGYDVTRLAWLLADLPIELLGRLRSDRMIWLPAAWDRVHPWLTHAPPVGSSRSKPAKRRTQRYNVTARTRPLIGMMPVILVKWIMACSGSGGPPWRR